jgi:hypothetical protein
MMPAQQSFTFRLAGQVQVGTTCKGGVSCTLKIEKAHYTHIGRCILEFETGQAHDMNSSYTFQHEWTLFVNGLQHNMVIADSPLQCAIWNESHLQQQL